MCDKLVLIGLCVRVDGGMLLLKSLVRNWCARVLCCTEDSICTLSPLNGKLGDPKVEFPLGVDVNLFSVAMLLVVLKGYH